MARRGIDSPPTQGKLHLNNVWTRRTNFLDSKRRRIEEPRRRSSRLSAPHTAQSGQDSGQAPDARPATKSTPKRKQPQTRKAPPKSAQETAIESLQNDLSSIYDRHDDRVRLLFHLEKFVSLVSFDPDEAKRDNSQVFEDYKLKYDLWSKVSDGRGGGRSTRRQLRQSQVLSGKEPTPEPQPPAPEPTPTTSNTEGKKKTGSASSKSSKTKAASKSRRQSGRVKQKAAEIDEFASDNENVYYDVQYDDDDNNDDHDDNDRYSKKLVMNPLHMPLPAKHGSLEGFLGSFISLDDDMTEEERDRYVESQIALRKRIENAKQRGMFKDRLGNTSAPELRKFHDPIPTSDTFNHHLTRHAVHFAKLVQDERRSHLSKAKKISSMIEQHFKRLEGAEEKERKSEEKRLRQLARKTAADVLKRWKLAEKVVQQKRAIMLEEQQRQAGKVQLNQILEQSAQLLESRIDTAVDDAGDNFSDVESEPESDRVQSDQADSDDESGDESMDSEVMSTSESEDEEVVQDDAKDEQLSVEELRKKYANLPEPEPEDKAESEPEQDEEQVNGVNGHADSESDESIPMDSEEDESMDSDSDDEGDEEEDSEEEEQPSALASLFSKPQPDTDEQMADSDDEFVEPKSEESEAESQEMSEPEDDSNKPAVKTPVPFLLRGTLREYQHYGLDWLAGLYNTHTNGILADEMGLGKTIQTISLLAYLACEKEVWGPHLIVVPTSVMLNWEMEFKRFAPGFKVLTYYGNPQQRKEKRKGWNKEDSWHVCITSYQLVLQDQPAFRRKRWHYMILDEAHNIKNFRSQRWQALLNFNSERRLLLTGTPLQNNLVELWSLLYFLMPSSTKSGMPDGFANLKDFQDWFARPVDKLVEGGGSTNDQETIETVTKLHQVLRPYLLRRLKADVEKQMPLKYEHVVYCRLSKRQRFLYDDFMSRAQTKETLASGNFLSIINCLMQLRKVCNHPDLFEVRPIVTSMAQEQSVPGSFEPQDVFIRKKLMEDMDRDRVNLNVLGLIRTNNEGMTTHNCERQKEISAEGTMLKELKKLRELTANKVEPDFQTMEGYQKYHDYVKTREKLDKLEHVLYLDFLRVMMRKPVYGANLIERLSICDPQGVVQGADYDWERPEVMNGLKLTYDRREEQMKEVISKYSFVTPAVVSLDMARLTLGNELSAQIKYDRRFEPIRTRRLLHDSQVKLSIAFPDKRLLQYDCGKLQRLATLLRELIDNGHRALIFTQMTKVLDILEQFLNIHGYRYLRLDGATRIEQRQVLTERFNMDSRIPVFILSTRSGGLGINLTGADTVIFYDSDWNPSMDKQCQDRCHRIGQTRDVHIYRFVSEYTIESNILRKATQKQILDNVVIQEGDFTTDYFNRMTVKEMLGDVVPDVETTEHSLNELAQATTKGKNLERALAEAEDRDDAVAASVASRENYVDRNDFSEKDTPGDGTPGTPGTPGTTPGATSGPSKVGSRSVSKGPSGRSTVEPEATEGERTEGTGGTEGTVEPEPAMDQTDGLGQIEGDIEAAEQELEEDDDVGHVDDYMIRFIENGYFY
uniref:Helicase SWR1 n=1 Tax=Blastobotrys adeninivorans TaxID=409370 RepID=A0A060SXZ3_BLAAD